MKTKSHSGLLLLTTVLAVVPAPHAEPPPIVRELAERFHAQSPRSTEKQSPR